MRKFVFLPLVIVGLSLIMGCNSKKLNNQWTDQAITIDGKYQDWETVDLQLIDDENLMLGSVNDAENLYIMFRFTDMELVRHIQTRGVTLWLDKNAKKEKKYGVKYTGSVDMYRDSRPDIETSDRQFPGRENRMSQFMEMYKGYLPGPGKIRVIENEEETERPENQVQGPAAGSTNQNGMYCYEFRLPIPTDIRKDNKMSLCIELGGLSSEDMKEMKGQMGEFGGMPGRGGRPGGPSGEPGGMPPGGGRGGFGGGDRRPGGRREMDTKRLESRDIWMKLVLAEKGE